MHVQHCASSYLNIIQRRSEAKPSMHGVKRVPAAERDEAKEAVGPRNDFTHKTAPECDTRQLLHLCPRRVRVVIHGLAFLVDVFNLFCCPCPCAGKAGRCGQTQCTVTNDPRDETRRQARRGEPPHEHEGACVESRVLHGVELPAPDFVLIHQDVTRNCEEGASCIRASAHPLCVS